MQKKIPRNKRCSKNQDLSFSSIVSSYHNDNSLLSKNQQGSSPTSSEWVEVKSPSSMVGRRSSHSSSIHNQLLYIYGGYDNNVEGIYSDFKVYNHSLRSWSEVALSDATVTPGKRHCHSSVVYQNQLFVFGGIVDVDQNTNSLFSYDFKEKLWKKETITYNKESLKNEEFGGIDSHKACLLGSKMVIITGFCQKQYNSNVYSIDLQNMQFQIMFSSSTSQTPFPEGRSNCSVNLYKEECIYLYGGKNLTKILGDFWKFDLKTNQFQEINIKNLDRLGGMRYGHRGSIVQQGKLFIFGGTSGVIHEKNDLLIIDLEKRECCCGWEDSQTIKNKKYEELLECELNQKNKFKNSRRNSVKRIWLEQSVLQCNSNASEKKGSSGKEGKPQKYRQQLREVEYYNNCYQVENTIGCCNKKAKKNPLLEQYTVTSDRVNPPALNTSTFQIISNSLFLVSGSFPPKSQPSPCKEALGEGEGQRKLKARDNHSMEYLCGEGKEGVLVVFGGDMHKICFNDLVLISPSKILGRLKQARGF